MASAVVDDLRKQMRERFPQAHGPGGLDVGEGMGRVREGGELFDAGMFPAGAISEVVPAGRFSGVALMVAGLLEGDGVAEAGGFRMVLVDGADGFDPGSFSREACERLLWVRCRSAVEMMKAADLLLHDGNMPFVLLDSTGVDWRELGRVAGSSWWRLRQVAERNGCRLVVMSERAMVPCASVRLALGADLQLSDFDEERGELLGRLRAVPVRSKKFQYERMG